MTDQYMKELLRVAVAQICQTIGYNATQTAPLELLQDVLDKFLREFTRDLRRQVEHYNRTEANLNDVTLTLDSINVNLNELLDYINNVEPVPFALEVPKFPTRKDSYLNFLKPGSKEVLTRPVHVHDHLPPMLPPEIIQPPETPVPSTSNSITDVKPFQENVNSVGAINNNQTMEGNTNDSAGNKCLNASAVLDKTTLHSLFKPSSNLEDGERPTREVSSVVMTTGGYISPAVEGKMPEAIVPDIIDKLLGLDAPPPPPPPPPPPQPRPPSRSATSTAVPSVSDVPVPSTTNKDIQPDKDIPPPPSTSKESKKALSKTLDASSTSNKKSEINKEIPKKKDKLYNPSKIYPHEPPHNLQQGGNYNKKSFMMHQNAAGMHTSQSNYANMLLKKAKKQKVPIIPGQPLGEKLGKPVTEKLGKLDAADKAHRKYMKMLQKMAKQGKIPHELLSTILGPDKKSKMINPAIVAIMPAGPEKIQLEKLLRKQAKQKQKMIKQQMTSEVQKQSKKLIQPPPPPLVPIFPLGAQDGVNKPLHVDLDEHKHKMEQQKELLNVSPVNTAFAPHIVTTPATNQLPETLISKNIKTPIITETPPIEIMNTQKPVTGVDGKECKLSNEPDRTKLNIFKKISKQKTPKSSSPIPMRIPGLGGDTPIINLPSGTTITPTPGPSSSLTSTAVGRNLFPPLPAATAATSNIINLDDIKDKPLPGGGGGNVNPNQPTDLTMFNRVFGEKPNNDVELINKPKKRGRKPGSKNSPKIPGVFPNNLLKKNNKKLKLDNTLFGPQMQIPPELVAAAAVTGANLTLDNMAQVFGNPINPMEWAKQNQLQQQMMIMAAAKDRKEHKKKNKVLKQDILNNDNNMASMNMLANSSSLAVPTNEEVLSINKKLMRMDTILKAAPSSSSNDLSIDTSLITGKKLPSPSMFPPSSSTSPLKSPGNSKRNLLAGVDAAMASLVQPFMLPNRSAFPNLPSNMLSMMQFPFPTRPGLIPTPGLFPTPGLGAFPNNPKHHLLPGLFPFPNLKQPLGDNTTNLESEDLTTDKKKSDTNLQNVERSYCNVAPLVPEFLTKLNESSNKHSNEHHHSGADLPRTPKPRNSLSNTMAHDNLLKQMVDAAHTPESAGGSISGKSIPSTPGGMSLNTFEQLMKQNDSPIDLLNINKQSKALPSPQESGLDFSMNKKSQNHPTHGLGGINTPITLNNEPIEVSDDSDETNQQQPPTIKTPSNPPPVANIPSQLTPHQKQQQPQNTFNMDEIFVANTVTSTMQKPMETDLSTKELKKLKKQVKKSSTSITTSLINTDKSEGSGVGKLAGGADLIPLASTGLAYSAKNIPFNSLTANANPSFNNHKTDFNTSSSVPPPTSSVFDNLTITAAIPSSSGSTSSVFDLQKKRKEHKKLKKLKEFKEGKIKKKKDKKDKTKSKDKAEKYLLTQTETSPVKEKETPVAIEPVPPPSTPIVIAVSGGSAATERVKDKDFLKKLKREKKKEKQRSSLEELPTQNITNPTICSTAKDLPTSSVSMEKEAIKHKPIPAVSMENESKKHKPSAFSQNASLTGNEQETAASTTTATKPSNVPVTTVVPKLTLKLGSTQSPTPPFEDTPKFSNITPTAAILSPPQDHQREPSPELARISPLVTRPPKHKLNTSGELATSSSSTTNSISAAIASTLEIGDTSSKPSSSTSNPNMIVPPPSPWLSGGTISASSVLLPHQLLQTTKQHDLTTTPTSATHTTDPQKTTNTDRQSPLTLITETSRPSSYIDAEGNRVWICPACGKVDDGSPMIGCDGCDAWYHWVCVGIFVAPKDNEDWFCRVCITRKKGLHGSDKKRKRNKKK